MVEKKMTVTQKDFSKWAAEHREIKYQALVLSGFNNSNQISLLKL